MKVVAARLSCDWRCDDHDIDPERPCRGDARWQTQRNCDGSHKVRIIFGGQTFDRCPVSWLENHRGEEALWDLYVDCCGGVVVDGWGGLMSVRHLPFAGAISDQPAATMEAFRIIKSALQERMQEAALEKK
jgi:hypothetical protein